MLHEKFGRRRRAIVPSPSAEPRAPLDLGYASGCALSERTTCAVQHGSPVRLVGIRASAGMGEMRVVGKDGDKDIDADAWRSKGMVYGEIATVGERVRPLVDEVGYVWVEGE